MLPLADQVSGCATGNRMHFPLKGDTMLKRSTARPYQERARGQPAMVEAISWSVRASSRARFDSAPATERVVRLKLRLSDRTALHRRP